MTTVGPEQRTTRGWAAQVRKQRALLPTRTEVRTSRARPDPASRAPSDHQLAEGAPSRSRRRLCPNLCSVSAT